MCAALPTRSYCYLPAYYYNIKSYRRIMIITYRCPVGMKTTMCRRRRSRAHLWHQTLTVREPLRSRCLIFVCATIGFLTVHIFNDISIVSVIIIIISIIETHGRRNDLDVIPVAFQSETESLIHHVGLRYVNRYPGSANRPGPLLTLSIH